ncbi:MAG: hypothetical protein ACP5GJ_04010 [Nanopusillaceae archaeon]
MRKIFYILPLLLLVILPYKVYSQSPIWPEAGPVGVVVENRSLWGTNLPLYTTQLVYQLNITKSNNLISITFTVPKQVLQQQLYYCKTYDPYITSINLSQCDFAYPALVALYDSSLSLVQYQIPYYTIPISYDNTTGLPQTFEIDIGSLSPGTYYIYVYYPSPFYYSFESMSNLTYLIQCPSNLSNITSSDFDGGWCSDTGGFGSSYIDYISSHYRYPYSQILYYFGGLMGNVNITRYLYVRFNPFYPVLIGSLSPSVYGYITIKNPYTDQNRTIYIPYSNAIYDLRSLELQNGLDPNQWNEIVNIKIFPNSSVSGASEMSVYGMILQYIPET